LKKELFNECDFKYVNNLSISSYAIKVNFVIIKKIEYFMIENKLNTDYIKNINSINSSFLYKKYSVEEKKSLNNMIKSSLIKLMNSLKNEVYDSSEFKKWLFNQKK